MRLASKRDFWAEENNSPLSYRGLYDGSGAIQILLSPCPSALQKVCPLIPANGPNMPLLGVGSQAE